MQNKSEYRLYADDELLCKTNWQPMAVAAWNRFTHDRDFAQHGGNIRLIKDGVEIVSVSARTKVGQRWPDKDTKEPDLRDLAGAIQQLARAAGIDAATLADAMTDSGMPTSRSRLDRIKTLTPGLRAHVSEAELIVMCYAAIGVLKNRDT